MIRQIMPDGFERAITITPAYDKRAEGKGQHVVDLFFTLIGPQGAVTLRVFSGWDYNLPDRMYPSTIGFDADDAGVFWCSREEPTEEYYGHEQQTCQFLSDGKCYSAGMSFSGGDKPFATLIREGEEPFWASMRVFYEDRWPSPAQEPLS